MHYNYLINIMWQQHVKKGKLKKCILEAIVDTVHCILLETATVFWAFVSFDYFRCWSL